MKRRSLREALVVPAGTRRPLGKWAFPDQRSRGIELPYEENTVEEDMLYGNLCRAFDGSGTLYPSECDMLRDFLKKGWYSDVFSAPAAGVQEVYRGMSVPESWIRRALGVSADDESFKDYGDKHASFTFRPKMTGTSSSWCTDRDTAQGFTSIRAKDAGSERVFSVVMTADTADNPGVLLAAQPGLYNLKDLAQWSFENEVLALAPVKVSFVGWGLRGERGPDGPF